MIVQRGYKPAGNYHDAKRPGAATEPLFLCHDEWLWGYARLLGTIDSQQDRWAVAAYIRALQLSQNAKGNRMFPRGRGARI